VNRREPIPEFVRDPRGQLTQPGERFLEPKLLLELDDVGKVRKQADRAARIGGARRGRDRDPEMRCRQPGWQFERTAHDGSAGLEAFGDDADQRRRCAKDLLIRRAERLDGHFEQAAAGRIQDVDKPVAVDDEQARGQAVGDLAA
jgi:hypothetical protein